MQFKNATRLFFAMTMIAIGLIGLFSGTLGPIWQPVPDTLPERQSLTYVSTFVALICGAGLLLKRTAAPAALLLLTYYLVWTILFKGVFIVRAPLVEGTYQSLGENTVLIAAAWILLVWSAKDSTFGIADFLGGNAGLRIARLLYGLALVAFGFSHFVYVEMTAPLVPEWLPAHVFWAYLTGAIYLGTGVAVISGIAGRLGAAVAAVQITLITLLVWGPMVLVGSMTPFHWEETIVSWSIMAGAWVVAASYEGQPWFGRRGLPMGNGSSIAEAG